MAEFFALGVIAAIVWYVLSRRNHQKAQQAGDQTDALNDTYGYLTPVADPAEIKKELRSLGSIESVIEDIIGQIETGTLARKGDQILGARAGNIRRGLELEEEIQAWEEEISTTAEFKRHRSQKPGLDARRDVWQAVARSRFPKGSETGTPTSSASPASARPRYSPG